MDKINLHCGDKARDGYENLDIRKMDNVENLLKIDDYALMKNRESSVEELIAHPGCLESIKRVDIDSVLQSWYRKLSVGGILKLSFVDIKKLANSYCYDRIPILEIEKAICGMHSVHDMFEIKTSLASVGFKIKYADFSIEDSIGTIHAEK